MQVLRRTEAGGQNVAQPTDGARIRYAQGQRASRIGMLAAPTDRSSVLPADAAAALPALYAQTEAGRYGIELADFEAFLGEAESFYLGLNASPTTRKDLRARLHVRDLVLARACARGHETAWADFLRQYQPKLRLMAQALLRDRQQAWDLADSLPAHLFGGISREGARTSKLSRYMGGGSLEAWLRSVLVQRRVDEWRRQRANVPWDEVEATVQRTMVAAPAEPDFVAPLKRALRAALTELKPEHKLVLTLYFLDGRHLADLATLFGVHESTMSRRVHRLEAALQRAVRRELLHQGLDRRAVGEALRADVRTLDFDLRQALAPDDVG